MINIGAFLQSNYSEFFAGNLTGQTEIKATNQGRLIESAQLLFKGLKSKDDLNEVGSLFVDPVPSKMDDCPAFGKEGDEVMKTEYAQKVVREGQVCF